MLKIATYPSSFTEESAWVDVKTCHNITEQAQ